MSPAAAPLDDDDLLSEILLRLPPQPSSLPRASAVCKRWHRLVSDPAFSRRHHRRNPPLLGFFHGGLEGIFFEPTLESPNRVPPSRFSLQLDDDDDDDRYILPLGCRLGFVLLLERNRKQVLVWSPITGDHHYIATPQGFDPTEALVNGAVLCSATGDVQHFKVVLVVADNNDELNSQILVCVYSSETGVWGNLISTPIPYGTQVCMLPAKLIGHSLNWLLVGFSVEVLEFDLEGQRLAVIQMPMSGDVDSFTVMPAEGGGLGFLTLLGFTAQLWKRKTDSDGVASWVMGTTIELDKLLSLNSDSDEYIGIRGFAEDNNLVFLYTAVSLFTVQFESLQFKKLTKPEMVDYCHPFESVYAAGI